MNNEHLGGHNNITNIDAPVFNNIVETFEIKSMIDIGCGPGGMQTLAKEKDVEWFGIDGDENIVKNTTHTLLHDFTVGTPKLLHNFDLAWSVEFLEHVHEEYIDNYMQVFQKSKYICCTAAPPGTPGHHHVNCKDLNYWIDAFSQYGFTYDVEYTQKLHKISKMRKKFFKKTGMFFYK